MIQNDSNIKISNREVKQLLNKLFGNFIQFLDPERKIESLLVYPSEINAEDVTNTLRNTDIVSEAAKMIQNTLMNHTFNLDDTFCDTDDLKHPWYLIKIPDEILGFLQLYSKYQRRQYYDIAMKMMMI